MELIKPDLMLEMYYKLKNENSMLACYRNYFYSDFEDYKEFKSKIKML